MNNQEKLISNTYEDESFVYEECFKCDKELTDTKDIFVSVETDLYYCKSCATKYRIKTVPCFEID